MDASEMTEKAREWQSKAENMQETAQQAASEMAGQAKDTVRDIGATMDSYLRDNPWTGVLVVAAIAGLLGYLLGSSRD